MIKCVAQQLEMYTRIDEVVSHGLEKNTRDTDCSQESTNKSILRLLKILYVLPLELAHW